MTKVEIELDTLRLWFNKLENNENYAVTELIYDKIQELEKQVESKKYVSEEEAERRKEEQEKILAALEISLTMKQIVVGQNYRIKKQPNFKQSFMALAGAEIQVVKKGRTKVTVRILEPGNPYAGQTLSTDITSLTNL